MNHAQSIIFRKGRLVSHLVTFSLLFVWLVPSAVWAWDLNTASYDEVSFSVNAQDTFPSGIHFKPDGTKMYMVGKQTDTAYQYTLSTPWDLNSASYDGVSKNLSSQNSGVDSFYFNSDGTKMYMLGSSGLPRVYQYTLSSAWDLSTLSYDSVTLVVDDEDEDPSGLAFKSDGTKMYMIGYQGDDVNPYTLSTAWDLSTASFDGNGATFSVKSQDALPLEVSFKSDGTKMYMVGSQSDKVHQYGLSTAWDLSTASYESLATDTLPDNEPAALAFKPDGSKMYVSGYGTDTVYQYSLTVPGSTVSNVPVGRSLVLASDGSTDVSSTSQSGTKIVRAKKGSLIVVDAPVDFDTDQPDWSGVTFDSDVASNKAVVHFTGSDHNHTGSHTLYVPAGSTSSFLFCPNATNLSEVVPGCSGALTFTEGQTQSGVTVSKETIDSTSYWKAEGVTGSGGQGQGGASVPEFSFWSLCLLGGAVLLRGKSFSLQ